DVVVRRGRDLDLRLQQLAHHLTAGDGLHLLEESRGHLAGDRLGLGVHQEEFLLDAELVIVGHGPTLSRANAEKAARPNARRTSRVRTAKAAGKPGRSGAQRRLLSAIPL